MAIKKNQQVSMEYKLTMEGDYLDKSLDSGVFEFVFGAGQILQGLESRISDMEVGESRKVIVPSNEAYGEYDINAKAVYLKEYFSDTDIEVGMRLEATGKDGNPVYATISQIMENEVVLDLNHPLAGKDLCFDIKVTKIIT